MGKTGCKQAPFSGAGRLVRIKHIAAVVVMVKAEVPTDVSSGGKSGRAATHKCAGLPVYFNPALKEARFCTDYPILLDRFDVFFSMQFTPLQCRSRGVKSADRTIP